ncbi:MAG TPA: hypothetical protein PK542_10800 [Treponemataceae bacterium]|nr:hypothetical protein [Treponemataceae bacterium]HPS44966.1 hypothetical protein [Treponemataceae bacterium]
MDILMNGNKIDFTIENERTLGEILGSLESACEKAGMTITAIRVDGKTVSASELDALFPLAPDAVASVELDTINADDIIALLREFGTRMTGFVAPLRDIPLQLQTGKDLPVLETIHRFSLDLQSLYQLLPLISIAGLSPERSSVDGIPLNAYPSELAPVLSELIKALETKDTVLAGDLSEYELAPRIERLGATLSAV